MDHFLVRACKTIGKIIVNLKIQEEAIASSWFMLAAPMVVINILYLNREDLDDRAILKQ